MSKHILAQHFFFQNQRTLFWVLRRKLKSHLFRYWEAFKENVLKIKNDVLVNINEIKKKNWVNILKNQIAAHF